MEEKNEVRVISGSNKPKEENRTIQEKSIALRKFLLMTGLLLVIAGSLWIGRVATLKTQRWPVAAVNYSNENRSYHFGIAGRIRTLGPNIKTGGNNSQHHLSLGVIKLDANHLISNVNGKEVMVSVAQNTSYSIDGEITDQGESRKIDDDDILRLAALSIAA
jgi:hypothetical protein